MRFACFTPTILTLTLMLVAPPPPFAQSIDYHAFGRFESPRLLQAEQSLEDEAYQHAVDDARVATASEVSRDLTALTTATASLDWRVDAQGRRQVRMVTWTGWDGYLGQEGQTLIAGRDIWSTPWPELRNFASECGLTSDSLRRRLQQRLGLPPTSDHRYVVEFFVDPDQIFRPAPDPEISDHEAEPDYPRSQQFISVAPEHREWMSALQAISYGPNGYPWTRLGYTYDWATPTEPVGMSEYVIRAGASIDIVSVHPTDTYARQGSVRIENVVNQFVAYARDAQQQWKIPAMAIGIVHRDQILLAETFGTRSLSGDGDPVTSNTLFQIGSVTKSMTAALTAILIDEGHYQWNDRVRSRLPEFRLQDPYVTQIFEVGDLMAQHAGLPSFAVTALSTFGYTPEQQKNAFRYVAPTGRFRHDFNYLNCIFWYAADLATQTTGLDYHQTLKAKLFTPMGMNRTVSNYHEFLSDPDHVAQHIYANRWEDGILETTPENYFPYMSAHNMAPAGSVCSSLSDMIRYLRMQMGNGVLDSQRIISEENLLKTRSPQTVIDPGLTGAGAWYGMGWAILQTPSGPLTLHTGDSGMGQSTIAFLPDSEMGVMVMVNVGGDYIFPELLVRQFFDYWAETPGTDHCAETLAEFIAELSEPDPQRPDPATPSLDLDHYAGTYGNEAYGNVFITRDDQHLVLTVGPRNLAIQLLPWDSHDFRPVLPWDDSFIGLVRFHVDSANHVSGFSFDLLNGAGLGTFNTPPPSGNARVLTVY